MDLKSIHEIFTNRILRIPSYQRGYSWANNKKVKPDSSEPLKNVKGQLKDLWDDLLNISNGGWHYTGLLTLVEVKDKDYNWLPNYKQFAIVDGQQRITSILILLSVIIKEAKKQNITLGIREGDVEIQYLYINKGVNAYIFGYDKDNPSDKFFRKHILNLDEVEDDSEESIYTENLLKAKKFFKAMVALYLKDNSHTIELLFAKVTTQLKLNEYVLPEELDEYVVFETMNNRGKPLSQLEKLKNRLLYLNDKFELGNDTSQEEILIHAAKKEQLSESINKAWITIYKSLGQNKNHPLDDEDFIKNHWIVYFNKYSRDEANVYANFLFDQYFTLQKVYDKKLTIEKVEEYIKSLQTCSVWWNQLHNPQYFEKENNPIKQTILGIHQVGLKASFKPILLAILVRKDRNDFKNAIKALEKYSFKLFDLSNKRGNTGDSKIYSLAHQVYVNNKNAIDTKADITLYTSWYYRFHLFVNQSYEMFELGNNSGFYKWSGRFYLLYMYDQYLRKQNRTSSQGSAILWQDFIKNDSIEHIYPQSATVSIEEYANKKEKSVEEVRSAYEKNQNDWSNFSSYTPLERKKLANSLGNLLAISQSDNSSLQNDKFLFKVDQSNKGDGYKNRGYKYDSMSAMLVANNTEWSPEKVLKRGLDILQFMCSYIGEDFNALDEITKLKVLGLEFMYKAEVVENKVIEEQPNNELA
ncbi:DUF262 domain-containing protein [Saccharicrinis aurantiacus]|uniref:DUF262 domain-containing protein n=1 Tax=Saccharicrinis aurantiacus TaxID=1849719 RepID=UPI00094FF5EC|nr:DUF262 domain-containing protein [Saccharicrinis aurantiacus]